MRRHKRIPLAASATLSFENRLGTVKVESITGNISASGMAIYSDSPLAADRNVSIRLKFFAYDGGAYDADLRGRIVYVREMTNMFYSGIELDNEITVENQPVLFDHIQRTASGKPQA